MTLKGDKWDFMKLRCRLEKELGLKYHCVGGSKISYYTEYKPDCRGVIPGVIIDEKDDKVVCAFLLHYINTGEFKVEDFKQIKNLMKIKVINSKKKRVLKRV